MLYIVRYSPWSSGPPTMFLSVTSDNATVFCYDFPTATTQQILEPEIIYYNHGCQDFLRIFVATSKKSCKVTKKGPDFTLFTTHPFTHASPSPPNHHAYQATIHDNAANDNFVVVISLSQYRERCRERPAMVGFSNMCSMPLLPRTAAP